MLHAIAESVALTFDDLLTSPDHYLQAFDGAHAAFVPMDRSAYHRSIFLDRRISPARDGRMTIPVADLAPRTRPPRPTAWIFHMAHCGSTLLARALDDPAAGLVLREPLTLRQSAFARDPARLRLALAMAAKRYRPDAPTLVKANVPVNFILPEIAEADRAARAILLYLPLRPYLLAILRNEDHRAWLRNVTTQLAPFLGDWSGYDDARRAAALWLAQASAFTDALSALPYARTLDAERFFDDPVPVLTAAASHLGLPNEAAALEQVVAGPLFATYSKNPEVVFDNAARRAREAAVAAAIAPEVARAEAWAANHPARATLDAALTRAALSR
jgi:hypothetical protein